MTRRQSQSLKTPAPAHNAAARGTRRLMAFGKRARISSAVLRGPFLPPEDWYEPSAEPRDDYRVVVRPAGKDYRHVVTEADVRGRLDQLPAWMVRELAVVQLSTMTRKKRRSPCYGMQWGSTIYLYPIEDSLIETFVEPPKPAQKIEAAMYGARWSLDAGRWQLIWTEEAIRDFYLNNVLIHELGHILDNRNASHKDRERFAEWFALEHGYKASRRAELAAKAIDRYVVRRHHRS
ncbi:MAG: hypothetical protein SFU86_00455 [Pirellulaceae bacterium]|nr:hypothetical protein [Pirellulaceae bacterium]